MTLYQAFSDWLLHSPWPCPAIALLVCLESSPVVGLLVPGFILIPAIGSLSAHGLLDFRDLLACALVGALCADSLGYWLGKLGHTQWHDRLGWRHSHRLQRRAHALFDRYGRLALFAGRIMWGIHPMVPMAAGAFGVRVLSFYVIDSAAALLWLLLHLGGGHWLGVLWLRLAPAHRPWMLVVLALAALVVLWHTHRSGRAD